MFMFISENTQPQWWFNPPLKQKAGFSGSFEPSLVAKKFWSLIRQMGGEGIERVADGGVKRLDVGGTKNPWENFSGGKIYQK